MQEADIEELLVALDDVRVRIDREGPVCLCLPRDPGDTGVAGLEDDAAVVNDEEMEDIEEERGFGRSRVSSIGIDLSSLDRGRIPVLHKSCCSSECSCMEVWWCSMWWAVGGIGNGGKGGDGITGFERG